MATKSTTTNIQSPSSIMLNTTNTNLQHGAIVRQQPSNGINSCRTPRGLLPPHVIPQSPSKFDSPIFRERVATLMHQGDTYARKMDAERRRGIELEQRLSKLRNLHIETKTALYQHATAEQCVATMKQKSVKKLENRLEKLLIRYNDICNGNKKLRDTIQSLRRDKKQHHSIAEKLQREIHFKQQQIMQTTSSIHQTIEGKDRSTRQTEILKTQVHEDDGHFETTWYEKKNTLEQDQANVRIIPRLRTPKTTDSYKYALLQPLSTEQENSPRSCEVFSPHCDNFLSTPDPVYETEASKNEQLLMDKKYDLRKQTDRLKLVEGNLAKILRKTCCTSADDIAKCLCAADEKNFSLFNMINQCNTEMEVLEIENNNLEMKIKECKTNGGIHNESTRTDEKIKLEEHINKSKAKVTYLEARLAEIIDLLDIMKTGTLGIFHKVCLTDDELAQIVASKDLSDANLIRLLGVIEQQIGQLVDIHNIAMNSHQSPDRPESKDSNRSVRTPRTGDRKNMNSRIKSPVNRLLRPQPPSTDDFNDSDLEDTEECIRLCNISDIQEKTAVVVDKRKDHRQIRSKR